MNEKKIIFNNDSCIGDKMFEKMQQCSEVINSEYHFVTDPLSHNSED